MAVCCVAIFGLHTELTRCPQNQGQNPPVFLAIIALLDLGFIRYRPVFRLDLHLQPRARIRLGCDLFLAQVILTPLLDRVHDFIRSLDHLVHRSRWTQKGNDAYAERHRPAVQAHASRQRCQ